MTQSTVYKYRAARRDGVLELGTIEAPSPDAAGSLLAGRGLFPVEINAERSRSTGRAISSEDLALGLRILASFLEAGLSISRALAALVDVAPPSWSPLLQHLREEVRQGASLGSAMRSSRVAMSPLIIGVIQAGEAGSGLAAAIRKAAELVESAVATKNAIKAAISYPIILAVAGLASLALLVGVVLPKFALILADLGQTLPPTTRLVLGVSDAVRVLFLPLLGGAVLAIVVWRSWVDREAGLVRWHSMLLDLPLIGSIRSSYAAARISASLAALLDAGVPLPQAMLHVTRAGGDAAIASRMLAARTSIIHGERPAAALEREQALTPTTIRLIRAGEETGRMAELLRHASRIEDERAHQSVRAFVRLLEPVLIVGFGLVVAIVAAALLQAVYSVRPTS